METEIRNPRCFFLSMRGLCATIATVITIIANAAYIFGSHMMGGASVIIKILAFPALPGLFVGALVSILVSGNIHGASSQAPSLLVGIPSNWLLYYLAALGVAKFRKS